MKIKYKKTDILTVKCPHERNMQTISGGKRGRRSHSCARVGSRYCIYCKYNANQADEDWHNDNDYVECKG